MLTLQAGRAAAASRALRAPRLPGARMLLPMATLPSQKKTSSLAAFPQVLEAEPGSEEQSPRQHPWLASGPQATSFSGSVPSATRRKPGPKAASLGAPPNSSGASEQRHCSAPGGRGRSHVGEATAAPESSPPDLARGLAPRGPGIQRGFEVESRNF